jgi:putative hydrolase of the HAD superfamily
LGAAPEDTGREEPCSIGQGRRLSNPRRIEETRLGYAPPIHRPEGLRMRHRAVFFDLGGTLFSYASINGHFDRVLEDMARGRGISAPLDELRRSYRVAMGTTMAAWARRPFYLHRDLFTEGHVQYLRSLGVEASADDPDVRFSERRVLGEPEVTPRPDAAETLAALRERGLHVSIVSNIDDDQLAAIWPRIGLAEHVDAVTTSEEARSCKPDERIFRLALEKAGGLPPETVLFVGDSPWHDVAGARALGMTTALIGAAPGGDTPQADHVIQDLRELLGLVGG